MCVVRLVKGALERPPLARTTVAVSVPCYAVVHITAPLQALLAVPGRACSKRLQQPTYTAIMQARTGPAKGPAKNEVHDWASASLPGARGPTVFLYTSHASRPPSPPRSC